MLSAIIEKILLQYLGRYIDGIKNSMDVALLKGIIKIQNVSLKSDFFNNLSLPLRLAHSKVQSIKIHIPWSNLKKEPTTVQVDGIYVLFYVNYELQDYKFNIQERFQQMVDKATQMIKMKFEQKQRDADTFVQKYIIRILDNIEVKVKNIHVRLQSIQRKWDFSVGVLINKIGVFTVNSQGQKILFERQKHHQTSTQPNVEANHPQNQVLQKKVQVQNIDIYFTQTQTQFLTLLDNKQLVLQKLKDYLIVRQQLNVPTDAKPANPQLVLRLKLQAVLKMQLNDKSQYDIDSKVSINPIIIELTDRMTAELFYFLQFTFEWQMRKYKTLNTNQLTNSQLVYFYNLMLITVVQGGVIDKNDYKTMLRVIQSWSYDFLVNTTTQFIKQQKIKRQLNKSSNQKISEDAVRLEEFKKEMEQKLFTDEQTKKMHEIFQSFVLFVEVPSVALVLLKSHQVQGKQAQSHPDKRQQILSLGLSNIAISYNTIFTQQTALAVSIREFALKPLLNRQQAPTPQTQLPKAPFTQPFLRIVFTKSHTELIQSCSINLSKQTIHIQSSLVYNLFTWASAIRLRPAVVSHINEKSSSTMSETIKKKLQMLFKEHRVISLNLHLPTFQFLSEHGDMLTLDLGKVQGKNISDKLFRLELVQRMKCSINQHSILQVQEGMFMEILDKVKASEITTQVGIQDKEKITWVVKGIKLQNTDKVFDFAISFMGSQVMEQFLLFDIVQNTSTILEGHFYLNRSPHRQKILLKSDKLYFLPRKYKISLQKCKIFQMHKQNKNYLVFHSLQNDKTDIVLVQNQHAMETIFYKIRQQIHENSTANEWDMYYKQSYPIQIGALENLKSKKEENYPLFTFFIKIESIILPLESYLGKQKESDPNQRLQFSKQKNLIKFFQGNDQSLHGRKSSKLQASDISLRMECFQLNTDYLFQVGNTKLVIQNSIISNNLSVSAHCSSMLYYSLSVKINSFELVVQDKEALKNVLQVAMLISRKIEQMAQAADEFDITHRVQAITKQYEQISMFTSSASLPQSQHSHCQGTSFNSQSHSLLDNKSFISLQVVVQMNSAKINILNYITDLRNLKIQVQIYRTQYFPSVKLQIQDLIILSLLQVSNLELELKQNFIEPFKYEFEMSMDRIVSYQNVQCIFLDIAQGEISYLMAELLDHLTMKKQARGKVRLNKRSQLSQFKDVQTHAKFDLDKFISPIKSIRRTQSKDSMKSLREQLLLEKQVYVFVFNCHIKSVSVQMFFDDNLPTLTFNMQNISLKQNELSVSGIKLNFSQSQMLNCKNITITVPKACETYQKQYQIPNLSLDINFNDFQSPQKFNKKQSFQCKKALLPQKIKTTQPKQQTTSIKLDTLNIELNIDTMTQITSKLKQMKANITNSTQYLQTKQKIKQYIDSNTKAIGKIPKKMRQANELTQVVQTRIKQQVPYDVKWIVDGSRLTQNVRLKTANAMNFTLYSMKQKQLITCTISTQMNYPATQPQDFIVTLNHYNHLIQLYEPIIEPMKIQFSHTKQHDSEQNSFKLYIPDLKVTVTEQIIIDVCNQLHMMKKVAQKAEIKKYERLTLDELVIKKAKLYEMYRELPLMGQKPRDVGNKQQDPTSGQQPVMDVTESVKGIFSMSETTSTKIFLQNFTWCKILCQLSQSQFPNQQIHLSDYSTSQMHSSLVQHQYLIIPYKKTHKQYTTPHQYLERQIPMKIKFCFIDQKYATNPITLDLLLENISTVGERRQFFQIKYQDNQGQTHETTIQVYLTYDYTNQDIKIQIKPKFQMINQTMVDLSVFSCNECFGNERKQQKFKSSIRTSSSVHLPFWLQSQIGLQIEGYQSKQSNKIFTVPLATQQNLLQNYQKQNYLLLKQQFVHNFQVKLGQDYCIMPLLIVKLKKYEKFLDKQSEKQNFRQVKCKVLILPLVTVENHLPCDIFINSQKYSQLSKTSQAIPFFLPTQFNSQIQSILFSFPSGQKYHVDLPSDSYMPKYISMPYTSVQSQSSEQQQINFNLLSCRNQFGQMILHFYPILQVIIKVPMADTLKSTVLTRVDYQDKSRDVVCESIFDKKQHNLVAQQFKKMHFLLSQNNHKIKFNLKLLKNFTLLTIQEQQNFTQTLESKENLGYINLQQLIAGSQSQSSSSSGSSSQSISTAQQLSQQQSWSSTSKSTCNTSHHLINIPTVTRQNQFIYCPYLLKVTKKEIKFQQEENNSVYDVSGIRDIISNQDKKKKHHEFYCFTLVPYNRRRIKDQNVQKARKLTKKIRKQLIQQLPQIQESVRDKISSVLLTLSVPNFNFSLVITNSTQKKINYQLNQKRRHELINVQVKGYEMVARFLQNNQQQSGFQCEKYSRSSIQIQHTIRKFLINSIDCQKTFKDSILKMNENKTLTILMALTNRKIDLSKTDTEKKQQHSLKQQIKPNFLSQIRLSKLFLRFSDQRTKPEQSKDNYHFFISLSDTLALQFTNWVISLYPFFLPLMIDPNQSLMKNTQQPPSSSSSLTDMIQKFQGLLFTQQIKLKLSFSSLSKKSHHISKLKKVKKQTQNTQIQSFLQQLCQRNINKTSINQQISRQQLYAQQQSKKIRRISKYLKKIPFKMLEVQRANLIVPQIRINGRLSEQDAHKLRTDLLVNVSTGIIKGMKLIGSPSTFVEYVQKKQKIKKGQKFSYFFERLAEGGINSVTGILKAFSSVISQLTFDQYYLQQREDAMEGTTQSEDANYKIQVNQSPGQQGIDAFVLGVKQGISGLVEQPVQNFKKQGIQGIFKGSLKGLTGLLTKPLTGVLDLGTKTLQSMKGKKINPIMKKQHFLNLDLTYCRPLFHQSSIIRPFTSTQHLCYLILKSFTHEKSTNHNISFICYYQLKQDPFAQQSQGCNKQNIDNIEQEEVFGETSKIYLAVCHQMSYVIQLPLMAAQSSQKEPASNVISRQIIHNRVRIIGKEEAGVCLVYNQNSLGQNDESSATIANNDSQMREIYITPSKCQQKEPMYLTYKNLIKFNGATKKKV